MFAAMQIIQTQVAVLVGLMLELGWKNHHPTKCLGLRCLHLTLFDFLGPLWRQKIVCGVMV